jgi:repressor LexA
VYSADAAAEPNGFVAVKPLSAGGCLDVPFRQAARQDQDDRCQAVGVPLVGRIRAGQPNEADEAFEDVFPLPRHLVGSGELFLLKVAGDSMIESAIADGDWVVVRQQPTAENGEIVAAMVGGEATVKTLKRVGGEVQLVPGNAAYAAIPGDQATILGKVVVVLRRL